MKRFIQYSVLLALAGLLPVVGCSDSDPAATPRPGKMISDTYIPSSMPVYAGQRLRLLGAGFCAGDLLVMRTSGAEFLSELSGIEAAYAEFTVPQGVAAGEYALTLRRDGQEQLLAYTRLRPAPDWTQIPDREGITVKGVVSCGAEPLAGVRVSDGIVSTTTDQSGYYWLPSAKLHGSVFLTLPSGYEPYTEHTVTPRFWAALSAPQTFCEQHNFELLQVDNDHHTMLVAADLHLANRPSATGDMAQFAKGFLAESSAFIRAQTHPVYTLLLGDITWDEFWYSNLYTLSSYQLTMAGYPSLLFHVMGNHDNDPYKTGDMGGESTYKRILGPSYYSMNIGKVHYIVLDNTVYINDGGAQGVVGNRNYKRYVAQAQLDWLREDLAALTDKSSPVVVAFHCQSMNNYNKEFTNKSTFNPSSGTDELISCFAEFEEVIFLSGHTHYNAQMPYSATLAEHNIAAVCETWWWAGKLAGASVCKDGSPAGYMLYEARDKQLSWHYKGIGVDRDRQFTAYDMNTVKAFYTAEVVELLSQWPGRRDDGAGDDYAEVGQNEVLINVWNYNPDWRIRVTEQGRELVVERVWQRDPLHTIAFDYPRLKSGLEATSEWESLRNSHMFRVCASEPGTTLHIEVTDPFGGVSREVMRRPKDFTVHMY